jgi:hypothetical protein
MRSMLSGTPAKSTSYVTNIFSGEKYLLIGTSDRGVGASRRVDPAL